MRAQSTESRAANYGASFGWSPPSPPPRRPTTIENHVCLSPLDTDYMLGRTLRGDLAASNLMLGILVSSLPRHHNHAEIVSDNSYTRVASGNRIQPSSCRG